ncbi:type VII toxin-antitoxin system MntA family adenylyltransferase antitoxin [Hydrogenimonas sp.]
MIVTPTKSLTISQLRAAFAALPRIRLALLFGSRAKGNPHPFSDYDFAVLMDGDAWERGEVWVELANLLEIGDEQIDLVDLSKATKGLKEEIASAHILLKGTEDELSRVLATT